MVLNVKAPMKNLFLFLLFSISLMVLHAQKTPIDGIIAVIGKEIIMKSDLEKAYQEVMSQYTVADDDEEITKCDILGRIVMQKLYLNQADLDSIVTTPQEVDNHVNQRIAYFVQQVGGDPKVIEKFYGKTMEEIKKDMREVIREQILVEQVQDKITTNIKITPTEVKSFYERANYDSLPTIPAYFEFGHIVKSPPVDPNEIVALKERLNSYRERVLRGEKFTKLARLYSDDPGSASKGGELGFVERGALYPEFEAVAFKLKTGEISQIVQTKAGYHIIQMIERRGETINVAHILLQPKPSVDEQVKAIDYLDSVRKVIIEEKIPFSQAALKFSDDLNKNSGGWVTNPYTGSSKFDKETSDPTLYSIINKLIPGEYSQPAPYVDEDGVMKYRLIYMKSRVEAHKPNLVEDYDVIQNAALEEKKYKAVDKWLMDKVKVTSIKISEEYKSCSFVQEWQIP